MNDELIAKGVDWAAIAVAGSPGYINSWLRQANAWTDSGDYDKAIAICDLILLIYPVDPEALYSRGYALYQSKQFLAAIVDFQNALAIQYDDTCYECLQDAKRLYRESLKLK